MYCDRSPLKAAAGDAAPKRHHVLARNRLSRRADRERRRQAVAQAAVGQTHGDVFFLAGVAVELWLKGLELGAARKAGARRAAAEAEFGGEAA